MKLAVSSGRMKLLKRRTSWWLAKLRSGGTEAWRTFADLERRLEETSKDTLHLGEEQRQQLLALGDDLEQVWDYPACPVQQEAHSAHSNKGDRGHHNGRSSPRNSQ